MDGLIETILEELDNQKIGFTNFNLNVPDADLDFLKKKRVLTIPSLKCQFILTKHENFSEIQPIIEQLRENFQREKGDFTSPMTTGGTFYLVATPLMQPGFKKSDHYKFIGLLEVYDKVIQLAWIHPFFRNKGLMTQILLYYGAYEGLLHISPPVSKEMQACMRKTDVLIRENPKIYKKQMMFSREWLRNQSPNAKINILTDKEVLKVRESLVIWEATASEEEKNSISYSKIIELSIKTLLFIRNNPECVDEMAQFMEKKYNIDSEKVQKSVDNYCRFGRIEKRK